ncbi:MAG: hypothetical protein ABUL71_04015 [Gemmatimonadota bacterium]
MSPDVSLRQLPTTPLLIGIVAVLAAACSSSTNLPPYDGNVALGTWGGDTAGLIVSDTAMHLHIGCTFGDVSGRVPLSAGGDFDVTGSYQLHAYPIAVGPTVPARFVGHLSGSKLTITVTVNDTVAHATVVKGPVVVRYGDEPQMGNCPICRRPIHTRNTRKADPR